MAANRVRPFPAFAAYLLSPVLVGLTTLGLLRLQEWLHVVQGGPPRTYITGFYLTVALMAFLGGRGVGFVTLALSMLSVVLFLTPPRYSLAIHQPSDWITQILLLLVGIPLTCGMDAWNKNVALLADAQDRAEHEALVNRIGQAIRGAEDPEAIQATAVRALGTALRVDRCYIASYDQTRGTGEVTHDHVRAGVTVRAGEFSAATLAALIETVSASPHAQVIRDVYADDDSALRAAAAQAGMRAFIRVPLFDQGRLIAVLGVLMAEAPRAWTAREVALVEAVATQTRTAVEGARLSRREHLIATSLQDALLPPVPAHLPGLRARAYYKAALAEASVGGDFFDVFPLSPGACALVVGDLSGKGLAAAAQVGIVRNMLRYALYRSANLADAITDLNAVLAVHDLLTGFATLFVGVYEAGPCRLTYVSCGHEPALVRRARAGEVSPLAETSMVLGATAEATFVTQTIGLTPGDALVLYTDGVSDAGRTRLQFLGTSGLAVLLESYPASSPDPDTLVSHLVTGMESHAAGELHDDVCLLAAVVTADK